MADRIAGPAGLERPEHLSRPGRRTGRARAAASRLKRGVGHGRHGALRARRPRRDDHVQPARRAERDQRRDAPRPQRRVRPLPRRGGRVGRDRHRRGQGVLRGRRHARRRRLGRRVRRHVLGEADDQLVRERLGDLQAGDRRGERLLPRLRAHARDVVRLRDRERARRVRLPRGAHRRADDRRRDPAPAAAQLAVRDGAAAHRRAHRRRPRQGDRARRLGRAPRRR